MKPGLGEGHDGLGVQQRGPPGRPPPPPPRGSRTASGRGRGATGRRGTARSARSAMRAITSTASTGIAAGGGLRREHDRRRRRRRWRWRRRVTSARVGREWRHHGLQHLGGHDHRHLGQPRLADDVLLDDAAPPRAAPRRRGRRAPPSPRRPAAGCRGRLATISARSSLATIGMSAPWSCEELADLLDVGGRAHEGDRHVVHAVLDAEAQVLAVLVGEARHRQRQPRQRHALVVARPRRPR